MLFSGNSITTVEPNKNRPISSPFLQSRILDVIAPLTRRTNRLTFRQPSDSAECKIYEITGKTVIYSFRSITRNITRRLFLPVSR